MQFAFPELMLIGYLKNCWCCSEKKASPVIGRRVPKQEPVDTPPGECHLPFRQFLVSSWSSSYLVVYRCIFVGSKEEEEYEEIQGRPSALSASNRRMQNIG